MGCFERVHLEIVCLGDCTLHVITGRRAPTWTSTREGRVHGYTSAEPARGRHETLIAWICDSALGTQQMFCKHGQVTRF